MEGRRYLLGDALTLADIPAGTALYRYFDLDIERPAVPNVEAWYNRLQATAGLSRACHVAVRGIARPARLLTASRHAEGLPGQLQQRAQIVFAGLREGVDADAQAVVVRKLGEVADVV